MGVNSTRLSWRYMMTVHDNDPHQCAESVSVSSSVRGVVQTDDHWEEGSPVGFSRAPWWYQSGAKGAPVFIQKGLKGVRGIPGGLPGIYSPQAQPPLHPYVEVWHQGSPLSPEAHHKLPFLSDAELQMVEPHTTWQTCAQHICIQSLLTHPTEAVIRELSVMSEVRGVEEEQGKTLRSSGAAPLQCLMYMPAAWHTVADQSGHLWRIHQHVQKTKKNMFLLHKLCLLFCLFWWSRVLDFIMQHQT